MQNPAFIGAAATIIAALFAFLGVYLTVRSVKTGRAVEQQKNNYDQVQEDLKEARDNAKSAHEEARQARSEAAQAWNEARALRIEMMEQISVRDRHIALLIGWINDGKGPPAPPMPTTGVA